MCKLKDRKEVAEGSMGFWFETPSGWTFKAGQYLDMTLLDLSETDSEEARPRARTNPDWPYQKWLAGKDKHQALKF